MAADNLHYVKLKFRGVHDAPLAGQQGYAISFIVNVMPGALTGANSGMGMHRPCGVDDPSGCGHLFGVIDVATLGSGDDYEARVDGLVQDATADLLTQRTPGRSFISKVRGPCCPGQSGRR